LNKINRRHLVTALSILLVLFLYFGAGAMIEGGFSGRMHANGLAGSISWRFYPAIIFLIFGAAAGWLLIRKREKSNKNMS